MHPPNNSNNEQKVEENKSENEPREIMEKSLRALHTSHTRWHMRGNN